MSMEEADFGVKIDQDTDDLQALTAVVGKEVIALAMTDDKGKNADYWKVRHTHLVLEKVTRLTK